MPTLTAFAFESFQKGMGGGGTGGGLVFLAIMFTVIAGIWKTFAKAGQPGWGVLVPIYNTYLVLRIAGRPGWWLLLLLIPIVNLVLMIIVLLDFARSFGKGGGFAMGLLFLPFIFYPILGFGPAEYIGPAAAQN